MVTRESSQKQEKKKEKKNVAVVLAAGRGSRMGSSMPKQYLLLKGKPLVCHCLDVLEQSPMIARIVVVAGVDDIGYMQEKIVNHYGYQKIEAVIEGGKERFHSVGRALEYIDSHLSDTDYVYIHDGARPYLEEELLYRLQEKVEQTGACIAAVPVKDTIKIVDNQGKILKTPERRTLWAAQTPQVFRFALIYHAYQKMLLEDQTNGITDDAQVLECMTGQASAVVEGSYRNIKITTPEDLE